MPRLAPKTIRARGWAHAHRAELNTLGGHSLRDTPCTVYTIGVRTFAVFGNDKARCAYLSGPNGLYSLGDQRKAKNLAVFVEAEHARRLRRWCCEQNVLPRARRSRVMMGVPR